MVNHSFRSSSPCVLDYVLHRAVLPFPPPCMICPRRTLALLENLVDVDTNGTGIQLSRVRWGGKRCVYITFDNCSSVCLLTDFSHGATSFSQKVNIMPISGRGCSQLITLQKMDTKELHP